jgi:hypothetical protein
MPVLTEVLTLPEEVLERRRMASPEDSLER